MTHLNLPEILEALSRLHRAQAPLGFDIEGGVGGITCCCFCPTPTDGLVIDLAGNPLVHSTLLSAITLLLEDPLLPKVCWNAAYERLILEWVHGIRLVGYEDAMFRWFERFSEPPKGLKYVSSLLTNRPFWAQGVRWNEEDDLPKVAGEALFAYNGADGCATIELWTHPQLATLSPAQETRYQFNLQLIEPLNYAMIKGVRYDKKKATLYRSLLTPAFYEAQAEVNKIAGVVLPEPEHTLSLARSLYCHKKRHNLVLDWDTAITYAKKDGADPLRRINRLLNGDQNNNSTRGELADLLGLGVNVKSNPQLAATLTKLGLPVSTKLKRLKGKEEDTLRQSADEESLLNLFLKTSHPIATAILKTRALRGRLQELDRGIDSDGRIRCSYSLLGTETGRLSSSTFPTGSGGNLQTVPKKPVNFRSLFIADPGQTFFACDLKGADGWTVAARCAQHGDSTYLNDLLAGIRIPTLVGLILEGLPYDCSDRGYIKSLCKGYKKDWRDLAMKKIQHGASYGASAKTILQQIVEESFKELGEPKLFPLAQITELRDKLLRRYWGLGQWWSWVAKQVLLNGTLTAASGHTREFLSRRPANGKLDGTTHREAIAFEPQANTTYVTNKALYAMWHDPENVPPSGERQIIALLSTHDELAGEFPTARRAWAAQKLAAYFTHPLEVGGTVVEIPTESGCGPSWGECHEKL